MAQKYYTCDDLIDRLCNAADKRDKTVTFLVGSPISLPDYPGGSGVPGVLGMIELIRNGFQGEVAEEEFLSYVAQEPGNPYQRAFEFLHGRRGQDAANEIVRAAVWKALNVRGWPANLPPTTPNEADSAVCGALEQEASAWTLPPTVDVFGKLLVRCFDPFGNVVLTTNFDPLIEISILKHSGRFYRTVMHNDGNLGQTVAEGTHVVHLHGYWHGADTLHTPQQLTQARPHLRRSLSALVAESILVVIGYSGWDDIITATLVELLSDSASNPEIMWAFHSADSATIDSSHARLLSALAPGIGRGRVSLYRGIECFALFSNIYEALESNYPTTTRSPEGAEITTLVKEETADSLGRRQLRIQIDIPMQDNQMTSSDQPLRVDKWVGRDEELSILRSVETPIVFITGLGGQGKSALAGRFLDQHAEPPNATFEMWDWRDCREESDRLGTLILRLIERVSNGAVCAEQIEITDIRAVVGMLFRTLQDMRALLVFDNVDQYVDLETLQPVKGLDVFIAEAQARSHNCLILFTCRPDIQVDESRATRIPLSGLSEEETRELTEACGVRREEQGLAQQLYQTTKGHPLWTRLIAMQAVRGGGSLQGALELIRQGGATLPDTTRTIWGTLNEQQRNVLRTMAELDRPESEGHLFEFLPGLNVNRVSRALRTLRSFHLIETRTGPSGELLLGLHPIIREFVRTSFPKKDREKYVGSILDFLNDMISRFKGLLSQDPSYDILEHWIRKAELQITFSRYEEATATIYEIAEPAINRGYSEELTRVAGRLFDGVDWASACSLYRHFDSLFENCLESMIQLGHSGTTDLLDKYEASIPGKSAQYILLCDLKCYANWYTKKYETAIGWGEEGERLRSNSAVDTGFSARHNLALSRRDAGQVAEALEIFLEEESLDVVLESKEHIEGKGAHYYGNIGRCLFFYGSVERCRNLLYKVGKVSRRRSKRVR